MEKKNPLLAGVLNMLVPGSGYWYVDRDRDRFIKTLIVGIAAIAALIVVGTIFQNTTGFPLPQGVCIGILLLIVLVPLFQNGQRAANHHNFVLDNASMYTTRQHGNNAAQLAKNQDLRDKGYISEQEYDSRKDKITSKK
jgi:Predicted membrane protein